MDLVIFENTARQNDMYGYILVVVDCFSKFLWTFPLKNKSASEILENLKRLFQSEGFPIILQSDNGGEFVAKASQEYFAQCGIAFRTSRAYRPQTQGQVERTNRTLKQAMYQDMLQTNNERWIDFLFDYTMSYNTMTHTATGFTPFEVHRGRKMDWVPNRNDRTTNRAAQFLRVRTSSAVDDPNDYDVQDILADEEYTLQFTKNGVLKDKMPALLTETIETGTVPIASLPLSTRETVPVEKDGAETTNTALSEASTNPTPSVKNKRPPSPNEPNKAPRTEKVIRLTDKGPKSVGIKARLKKIDGLTQDEALKVQYSNGKKLVSYSQKDLDYDIERGYINLQ